MMVATINFKTKELKLTSFLRDMYVEIPGHGRNKLNAAYAFGGKHFYIRHWLKILILRSTNSVL